MCVNKLLLVYYVHESVVSDRYLHRAHTQPRTHLKVASLIAEARPPHGHNVGDGHVFKYLKLLPRVGVPVWANRQAAVVVHSLHMAPAYMYVCVFMFLYVCRRACLFYT